MSLGIITSDFSDSTDLGRVEVMRQSPGMRELDGNIGVPFVRKKEWPSLGALMTLDCGTRKICTGCERLTKTAEGLVVLLFDAAGINAKGAVCTTTDTLIPYKPIYFQAPVTQ